MTELLAALSAVIGPFVEPGTRLWAPGLLVAGGITAWRLGPRAVLPWRIWRHPSSVADLQLFAFRGLLRWLGWVPELAFGAALAVGVVRGLDAALGVPSAPTAPTALIALAYSLALFVAWDASRYLVHRLAHEVPALWELHQVHHSAEVLTPLTFYRIHPLEGLINAARGALVTGLLAGLAFWFVRDQAVQISLFGVNALGLLANVATGNLRHSHVRLGFGDRLEGWLMSPAQHQLHHADDRRLQNSNYGTWLAVWDRLGGSLVRSSEVGPVRFGLAPGDLNHAPDDLPSMLLGPLVALARRPGLRLGLAALIGLLGLEAAARAEDAVDEIVITGEGVPVSAGSAQVIGEAELERQEHDDIHRVLGAVPGVYVRGEDGFGLRPNIGLRGANSDRSAKITLMEDGVLFGPAPYAAPAAYYFPMTTRLAGVEVFKGASGVTTGPHTVGGAINLLTRPVPEGTAGAADLALGQRGTAKAHLWAGHGAQTWGLLVEGAHLSTDGFKRLDGGGPTGFERQEAMLKAWVGQPKGTPTRHTAELKLGYALEDGHETYLGLSTSDFEQTPFRRYAASQLDHMSWGRSQAELAWRVRAGDRLEVRTVAYTHHLDRSWTKLNRFAGGPDLHALLSAPEAGQAAVFGAILRGEADTDTADQRLQIGTNHRVFRASGLQSVARWNADFGGMSSRLEAGARYHADRVHRVHTEDPYAMVSGALVRTEAPTETLLDLRTQADALAFWLAEDLAVGAVRFQPGARLEVIRTEAEGQAADWRAVPLPGLGVLGTPLYGLDLFAGLHRGFSPVAPGQPTEVAPEQSWNAEAGARAHGERHHLELVGFFNDYQNLTGTCTLSGGCTEDLLDRQFNGGSVHIWGAELLARRAWPIGAFELTGQLAYTYTGSAFQTGFVSGFTQFGTVEIGDSLPYVPEHQGQAQARLDHARGGLTLAAHHRSALRDEAGQGKVEGPAAVPAATLVDLSGELRLQDDLRVYLAATNLLDAVVLESWRPFGARPAQPRQVMVGVKVGGGG